MAAVLAASLGGCGGTPEKPEDCEGLAAGKDRDECYAQVAPEVFRRDPKLGDEIAQRIEDPMIRDFVYLTVTREIDPGSPRWCEKIEEDALESRCRVLVSRPHLHRELLRQSGEEPPGGPGGGPPPPGGGPPPGGPGGGPPPGGPPPEGTGAPPPPGPPPDQR